MIRTGLNFTPGIGDGVYTIADAAHILGLPRGKLGRWITGYWWRDGARNRKRTKSMLHAGSWNMAGSTALNFHALIELFTFAALRGLGVGAREVRRAHDYLAERLEAEYPFACQGVMTDGKHVLMELGNIDPPVLVDLGRRGQTELLKIVGPFCQKIEFDQDALARCFWPLGKDASVVVDPHHSFGKPVIQGTNLPTETIHSLHCGGESAAMIGRLYDIPSSAVLDAIKFEKRKAA